MPRWRWPLLAVVLLVAACGREQAAQVQGDPVDVVRKAAAATLAQDDVQVEITTPTEQRTEVLDLATNPTGLGEGPLDPDDPVSVLHLLAGVSEAENFGGVALRGVATRRFDVVIDLELAGNRIAPERRDALGAAAADAEDPEVDAKVWVDLEGRVRRVELPTDLTVSTPPTVARGGVPSLVTIDFLRYGGDEP